MQPRLDLLFFQPSTLNPGFSRAETTVCTVLRPAVLTRNPVLLMYMYTMFRVRANPPTFGLR